MLQLQSFTFSPIQENTYVLYQPGGNCAIIDPGCYFAEEQDQLAQFITDQQLTPILLLNTHCHLDHVFGLKWAAERYQLTPSFHPKEQAVLSFAPTSGLMYNLPFDVYTGAFNPLQGGDRVQLGGQELSVIDAPGHSPGSICFYSANQQLIVSGDVLFHQSIGRTDLPGGNHATLIQSIREALFTLPDETKVFSGHGPATSIGWEKQHNPYVDGIMG